MENLHVQPKRKSYAWVWILVLILIIAAAAYYFMVYKKQAPAPDNVLYQRSSMPLQAALKVPVNNTFILF